MYLALPDELSDVKPPLIILSARCRLERANEDIGKVSLEAISHRDPWAWGHPARLKFKRRKPHGGLSLSRDRWWLTCEY